MVGLASVAVTVYTQEPQGPAVVAALAGLGLTAAAAAGLVLLRFTPAGRSTRARATRVRAVRRGLEAGAALGLIAALQVIGGLTPLTAFFVILSFAIAEYVLSAGASPSR